MSAIGTKRTSLVAVHMSAFRCKADMTSYSTRAKSRHRAPHGSFMLRAIFFGRCQAHRGIGSMNLPPNGLRPRHFDVFNPCIQQFQFVGGVEVDNKDRSDQSDHREGNQNLCAAVFSFFHSTNSR